MSHALRAAVLCASDRIPIDALRAQLAGDGIAVQEAGNGRAAWAALLQSRPAELLIVECALQGINGFDLCRLVRAHPNLHRMPIVLVCAAERLPASLQGLVDRYLAAPVETEDLVHAVRELLRGVSAAGG